MLEQEEIDKLVNEVNIIHQTPGQKDWGGIGMRLDRLAEEGELTEDEIRIKLNITKVTLSNWRDRSIEQSEGEHGSLKREPPAPKEKKKSSGSKKSSPKGTITKTELKKEKDGDGTEVLEDRTTAEVSATASRLISKDAVEVYEEDVKFARGLRKEFAIVHAEQGDNWEDWVRSALIHYRDRAEPIIRHRDKLLEMCDQQSVRILKLEEALFLRNKEIADLKARLDEHRLISYKAMGLEVEGT